MEKFYKLARISAIVIIAEIVFGEILYPLINVQWKYYYLVHKIINISIYALLIWTFSILIHNSENGSRVKKASILAIIGFGICIANDIYKYISPALTLNLVQNEAFNWIIYGYFFEYSVLPWLLIIGEILLCIATLSIIQLFSRKSLVNISGIVYIGCLLVRILSDVYYFFWISGSNNYDFESLEWHIYSAIRVYICYWLEQISLALFLFSLSILSNKKQ